MCNLQGRFTLTSFMVFDIVDVIIKHLTNVMVFDRFGIVGYFYSYIAIYCHSK